MTQNTHPDWQSIHEFQDGQRLALAELASEKCICICHAIGIRNHHCYLYAVQHGKLYQRS